MRGENRFYGVDTSSVAVEFCKKKFTNGTYSFLQGSLPNVVLPEKVDFVICNNVLQYFERDKHDAIFNNIHSLLKSDGIFFMMTPLKNKNAKELIQQLSVYFDVCAVDYVYGALDYFLIEKKCSNLVNEYYFGNIGDVRFRSVKKILGWVSYSLMKSKSLSGFLFWVNKYFLPFWKSHMICECKNRN